MSAKSNNETQISGDEGIYEIEPGFFTDSMGFSIYSVIVEYIEDIILSGSAFGYNYIPMKCVNCDHKNCSEYLHEAAVDEAEAVAKAVISDITPLLRQYKRRIQKESENRELGKESTG